MRALGYSKRQAKAIAARGFKALDNEGTDTDDASEKAALMERMKDFLDRIERNPI